MKKILLSLSVVAASLYAVPSSEEIIKKIEKLPVLKSHRYTPVSAKDKGSLYFVQGYFNIPSRGPRPAKKRFATMYIPHDLSMVVYGQGFDAKTAVMDVPYTFKEAKKAASFAWGEGKDEYIVVVDPLCPFCKKLDRDLANYKEQVKIYFVFMPLTRLHPQAKNAIATVMMQPSDNAKYKMLKKIAEGDRTYKNTKTIPASIEKKIEENEYFAQKMGATGTPSVYIKRGDIGRKVNPSIFKQRYAAKSIKKKKQ